MSAPMRIQLCRRKGWRMPRGAVKVDRTTYRGNPYVVGVHGTRGECVDACHRLLVEGVVVTRSEWEAETMRAYRDRVLESLDALRGCHLACWCPLCEAHSDGKPLGVACAQCAPCHADLLLELANGREP